MESVKRFIAAKLKLKANEPKSAVAKRQERKFPGFSFTDGKEPKRRIAPKAIDRLKERMRGITHRSRGRSMEPAMAELVRRGASREEPARIAGTRSGPWRVSQSPALHRALSNAYLTWFGLPSLIEGRNA
jgi:RNA-directed DNA polymerase